MQTHPRALRDLLTGTASSMQVPPGVRMAGQRLMIAAEAAKRDLSEVRSAEVLIPDFLGRYLDLEVSRPEYDRLIAPLVDRSIEKVEAVLAAAHLSADDVDRVVLVGGATRNRLVWERLTEVIKEPWAADRVDETVAEGASIYAEYLRLPQEVAPQVSVRDVTPFSLGVCARRPGTASEFFNSILIRKNQPVPATCAYGYLLRPGVGESNELHVHVLQGEDSRPEACLPVGEYIFPGITSLPGRPTLVELEFGYDQNSIVSITAREPLTGRALPTQHLPMSASLVGSVDPRRLAEAAGSQGSGTKGLPYTRHAGSHRIPEVVTDDYGNARGSSYDLVADGAFDGYGVGVIHLYTGDGFDFALPGAVLAEKGFRVQRWTELPSPAELRAALNHLCQLWLISSSTPQLEEAHLHEVSAYFQRGGSLYLWGDNDPYSVDTNRLTSRLFGVTLAGDDHCDQTVGLQAGAPGMGFRSHFLTTGIQNLYEGFTVASLAEPGPLEPLLYGTSGKLVVATYDSGGKRAVVDGGFTRLYRKWDSAGTARYVKNAAAWLANCEHYGYFPSPR